MRLLAVAAFAASTVLVVPPAVAADRCLAVTGTLTTPEWTFHLTPGLTTTPATQNVSLVAAPLLASKANLVCTLSNGAVTYTGDLFLRSEGAAGASFAPEDLASGAGSVDGIGLSGTGDLTTSWTTHVGTYHFASPVTGTVSLSYARAGGAIALVMTLHDFAVDVDGPGVRVPVQWGDVPATTVTTVLAAPLGTGSDLVQRGRVEHFRVTPAVAVTAGT